MSLALAMKHSSHVTTAHAESFLHDQDPLLTSLADAFKTAFERLSGSDVFGLMPDPPFSLSPDYRLSPSFGCRDDAIRYEANLL